MSTPTTTITTPTPAPIDLVTLRIDEVEVAVPKGTLVIRAAERAGIQIPRFCDHPLLEPVGACRQCLVEVASPGPDGNLRPFPKPQAACTTPVAAGMVVKTARSSEAIEQAQRGVMEFLLANHPLDCPICDKAGECPLQNQALAAGGTVTRFVEVKRRFPKPVGLTAQILLDRERCVLCQRCVRFAAEIAGDPFIALQKRGTSQQIGRFDPAVLGVALPADGGLIDDLTPPTGIDLVDDATPATGVNVVDEADAAADAGLAAAVAPVAAFSLLADAGPASQVDLSGSYFAGNIIQICPVGALTSASYRFKARPFDLVSAPSVAEHDSSCSAIRIDHRHGQVVRRLAGEDPEVNQEWITDKDRFGFAWQQAADRLTTPLVRDDSGQLRPASWSQALAAAAAGLAGGQTGVLPGGRLTLEDAYAYAVLARKVLRTNDVDFRARPHSLEEEQFLLSQVAGPGLGVTMADLESAGAVLLVGFEPEEEGGVVFLRLRHGVRAKGLTVYSIAPFASPGLTKLQGQLLAAAPGTEPEILDAIDPWVQGQWGDIANALAGGVVVLGERLANVPGAFSAAAKLADRLGARLAWIPRRVGERAAVEFGLLPNATREPVPDTAELAVLDAAEATEAGGRADSELATRPGRNTTDMLAAAARGDLTGLVVGGLDIDDLPDPLTARDGFARAFVVSLEVRASSLTDYANVVFPVAPPVEKPGTFISWEGRLRPFAQVLTSTALSDARVLEALAAELGETVELRDLTAAHEALSVRRAARAARVTAPPVLTAQAAPAPRPGPGQAVLATWHTQLDSGRGQDGDAALAAPAPVARLSAATARSIGLVSGQHLTVSSDQGSITAPVVLTEMPAGVVWLPTNSPGSQVRRTLGPLDGGIVRIAASPAQVVETAQPAKPAQPAQPGTKEVAE